MKLKSSLTSGIFSTDNGIIDHEDPIEGWIAVEEALSGINRIRGGSHESLPIRPSTSWRPTREAFNIPEAIIGILEGKMP